MHLFIAVQLRDLDNHGNINGETRYLCENMRPYYVMFKTIQRPLDKLISLIKIWDRYLANRMYNAVYHYFDGFLKKLIKFS